VVVVAGVLAVEVLDVELLSIELEGEVAVEADDVVVSVLVEGEA